MSGVERYAFVVSEDYVGAKPREDGAYVLYGDYTALQQKLDAVLADNVALKQRAEVAEAKLAEMEKQEGRVVFTCTGCEHSVFDEHPSCCDCGQGDGYTMSKVFTRPAPAINLAELVPDEALRELDGVIDWIKGLPIPTNSATKWLIKMSDLRDAILCNIEEKSK